ncbi:MAG: molybdopterin molybdenumtransferase MoeA, partial [Zoogloea sp.]|nr:molybdopterin molybdenumtransferase MoeA [Zoogloea sp.]
MKPPLISFEAALERLLAAARPVSGTESMDTFAACGRVLAEDLVSGIAVPPLDNSAMDGYALRAEDVSAPGARLPVAQRIPAGSVGHTLAPGTAARIFTGAPVPAGADAVVMQELCEADGETVLINHRPRVGEAIRRAGEDIAPGAVVVKAGSRLAPQALGLAASVGRAR